MTRPFAAIFLVFAILLVLLPGRTLASEGSPCFIRELERGNWQKIVADGTRLAAAAAWPHCEIILMIMNPPTGHALEKRSEIRHYESGYREVARKQSCRLIGFSPESLRIIAHQPSRWRGYAGDGPHPAPQACDEVILPKLLRKIGFTPGTASEWKTS